MALARGGLLGYLPARGGGMWGRLSRPKVDLGRYTAAKYVILPDSRFAGPRLRGKIATEA